MIIHSVVASDIIFNNDIIFSNEEAIEHKPQYISYKGEMVEVEYTAIDQCRVTRIIGTSLKSYLDPKMQPGSIIKIEKIK